ncbi:FxsA family membrane protein [Streptomyces sp. NBC_01481]|uniref:FxsA family membrane protein n=1 Tax=Streptomyces sp. NBC_01481 TaxID=2975869 RepID=UPI002251CE79|nr:FxsA family membrane protein [Streptomyces sp. NBC_01481]MCX4588017.1 FxsA family protein [Streptomyces sp. NBC_01481]
MTTGSPTPTAPKRSRARTFVPLGIAAWVVLEVWLLTLVASAAGGLTVLALLVGGAVLGAVVIKRAGRRAFRSLTETLQQQQQGQSPAASNGNGTGTGTTGNGFLMLGGLLLMLPGLISDVVGLALLVRPVRTALGRYAERSLERRVRAASPGSLGDAFQQARIHRPDGKVVQGEVIRPDATRPSRGYEDEGPRPPLTP